MFSMSMIALTATAATPVMVSDAEVMVDGAGGDRFGYQIDHGDLNDDGEVDLVVSAPHQSAAGNRVYVFFGPIDLPSQPTLDASQADVVIEGATGSETGWSVTVGDAIGGGEDDLIVASPSFNGRRGRISVFEGPLSGGTLQTASDATVTIDGTVATGDAGWSLAAGDWDADGKDEIAIGACSVQGAGTVYLMDADSLAPMDTVANATSSFAGIGFTGCALANLGDFDGDGFEDLAIGSSGALVTTGAAFGGTVSIVYGRSQFGPNYTLLGMTPAEDIANLNADKTGSNVGYRVAAAGDLNHDGFGDILVGAPAIQCPGCSVPTDIGRTFVVLGGPSNGKGVDRYLVGNTRIDTIADVTYTTQIPNEGVGRAVASAGFAGQTWGDTGRYAFGSALLGPTLLVGSSVDEAWIIAYDADTRLNLPPTVECTKDPETGSYTCVEIPSSSGPRGHIRDLDSTAGVHQIKGDPGSAVGVSVHGPGDLDGDGLNDLAIGMTLQIEFETNPPGDGSVLLYQGY